VDSISGRLGRVKGLLLGWLLLTSTMAAAETAIADRPTSSLAPTMSSASWLGSAWHGRVELETSRAAPLAFRLRHAASGDRASTRRALRVGVPASALSVVPGKVAFSLPARPAGLYLDLRFVPREAPPEAGLGAMAAAVFTQVRQAYATVKLFDLLTVDLGKFVNVAGPGVIESTGDWLGSRAERLAGAADHAGLRFALPVGEVLTLRGSLLASQAWKTFNLSATVHQPGSGTSVFVDVSGGPNVNSDLRLLFDVVVNQVLRGERLVTDAIRLVGHVEYFADGLASGEGPRRGPVNFITATVGAGLHFAGAASFELRPELRRDQALGGFLAYHGGTTDSRTTIQLAAIARF